MRMPRVILLSVACPDLQFFPHIFLINDMIFEKKSYWKKNIYFDFVYSFFL